MKLVHVAVAVIERSVNGEKQIFIAKRPDHVHQGGLWEFPGGKVEQGESVVTALARELHEELGITVETDCCRPLIQIEHDYSDKSVLLDVWKVERFTGRAHGKEGQPTRWVSLGSLADYDFPEASRPIISACRLPEVYAITPENLNPEAFSDYLETLSKQGVKMLLFRQPSMTKEEYRHRHKQLSSMCTEKEIVLLASGDMLGGDTDTLSVQVSAQLAKQLTKRPVDQCSWFAVSCHSEEELSLAQALGADFVTLSPINETKTHPGLPGMGWQAFTNLVRKAKVPVYALGGMQVDDLLSAQEAGAQGIAGIRLWLPEVEG